MTKKKNIFPRIDPMETSAEHMLLALELAQEAADKGEVPVGAVIVDSTGAIIGRGANRREQDNSPIAHAEILAINAAAKTIGSWRLTGCTLYVTLEPCPMCAGAILNARIPKLVYGTADPKAGAVNSLYTLLSDSRLNHRVDISSGMLADDCGQILTDFFTMLRSAKG